MCELSEQERTCGEREPTLASEPSAQVLAFEQLHDNVRKITIDAVVEYVDHVRGLVRKLRCGLGFSLEARARVLELLPLDVDELLAQRYERFRKFGAPGRQPVLPPITGEK